MTRYTIAIVAVLVLVLLSSTAGLVAATRTTPDIPGQAAVFAPGPAPQPADDDDDDDEHPGPHIKFEGPVESVSIDESCTGNIRVANAGNDEDTVTVQVTCDTKIKHGSLADIKKGDWVKVKGWHHPEQSNTVIAKEIKIKEHHGDGDECRKEEFYGELTGWNGYPDTDPGTNPGDWWIIGSRKVLIDENTEIKGTPAAKGDLVKVEACRQQGEGSDTVWVARELKVHHRPDDEHDDRVEFRAKITGPDPFFVKPWWGIWELGEHWLVEVTSKTAIVGIPQLYRVAEVHGKKVDPSTHPFGANVVASKIEIKDRHHPGQGIEIVKVEGHLGETPSPDTGSVTWDIEGVQFTVDANTLIIDFRTPATRTAWAEMRGVVEPDGEWLAKLIKTEYEDEPPGEVHVEGTYQGAVTPTPGYCTSGDVWNVSGWEVCVPDDVGPAEPLADGDRVKVKAMRDDNNTEDDPADDFFEAFHVKVKGKDHD